MANCNTRAGAVAWPGGVASAVIVPKVPPDCVRLGLPGRKLLVTLYASKRIMRALFSIIRNCLDNAISHCQKDGPTRSYAPMFPYVPIGTDPNAAEFSHCSQKAPGLPQDAPWLVA